METENSTKAAELIAHALEKNTPKAAGFIVTIYGDVIEPRGGIAWIGNLIETCAKVGISETLVRTAVSRLVAAGQLSGERNGRRSYYRLSASARAEFSAAARILFGPAEEADWHFLHLTGPQPEDDMPSLERLGYARLGSRLAFGPRRPSSIPPSAVMFQASLAKGNELIPAFVAEYWNLDPHATAYNAFIGRFMPLVNVLDDLERLTPSACLTLRLLLVHQFRHVVLHDPRFPAQALPVDWPGHRARQLFAKIYRSLSTSADGYVARKFVTGAGPLPEVTETTRRRLETV